MMTMMMMMMMNRTSPIVSNLLADSDFVCLFFLLIYPQLMIIMTVMALSLHGHVMLIVIVLMVDI